jgi:fibronectin type 3 domain-containing protein
VSSRPERLFDDSIAGQADADAAAAFADSSKAKLEKAWKPVFELLETRRLMDGDSVFRLDFDQAAPGTLVDNDGEGIGFDAFQDNANNDGFRPDLLDLDATKGILKSVTTGGGPQGSNFQGDNTHANLLQTDFDATTSGWIIESRLLGPDGAGGITQYDDIYKQGGIFFGEDQDNYVKLVIGRYPDGNRIEFTDEYSIGPNMTERVHQNFRDIGDFGNYTSIDLRLVGDAATGEVQAYFRTDPNGAFVLMGELEIPASKRSAFFKADGEAGVIQSSRWSNSGAVTAVYDSFEIFQPVAVDGRPTVSNVSPANGAVGVSRDAAIFASIQSNTSGSRIDAASLDPTTVRLIDTATNQQIPAIATTSGAGDVIVLTPSVILGETTEYRLEITDGVTDTIGNTVVPFTSTFTTGTQGGTVDGSVRFDRSAPSVATQKNWTGLTFGPDGKLYATSLDGEIYRFDVATDGTLSNRTLINTVRQNEGFRAVIGLTFDPASTATDLVAYITHGSFEGVFEGDAPEWSGKLTKLSGPNLENYQDLVIGLPRSVGDHLSNQPVFGPDGKLYFSQAANTAMGESDPTWSEADGTPRPEQLLTAAILQIDLAAIGDSTLNVQTEGIANPYDPFAADAPVKIYATGVRNAYDLVWHSNGQLYAPTNGSGSGGSAPASPAPGDAEYGDDRLDNDLYGPLNGPQIPGLTNVPEVQSDFLFRVTEGGYYGSPNPVRDEWVLNGGNPTAGTDLHEVVSYPEGTQPDRNWRDEDVVYDFGKRISSNGAIEYIDDASTGTPFGGALDGKLFVTRYSLPKDIVILSLNGNGQVIDGKDGFDGLEGFQSPLDIVQQPGSGNLFVADIFARQIYLLRPDGGNPNAAVDQTALHFSDNHQSADRSTSRQVTVTNDGVGALNLSNVQLTGPDAARFNILNGNAAPDFLVSGQSFTFEIDYVAGKKGIESAFLQFGTNDPDAAVVEVKLRGLGTTGEGGQNEPSLQRILDLYEIPVDVGDPDPNTTEYPSDATLRGDEVIAPRFTKAGSGDVTIDVLAVMAGVRRGESMSLGTYTPGTSADTSELIRIFAGSEQTVNPEVTGTTSFNPGEEAFSFYGTFAAFHNRTVYGENDFNTWENNNSERRKVRTFPLKDENGQVVPNAYIVTFEEWEQQSDQNDIVFIVRNVAPSVGPVLGVQNLDGAPLPDRLVFSRINENGVDTRLANTVKEFGTVRLSNTGENPLEISDIALDTADWQITGGNIGSPITLQPGQTRDVTVQFVYDRSGLGNEVRQGTLTITTDSIDQPVREITLGGIWQSHSEDAPGAGTQEPTINEIVAALGYQIDIGDVWTDGNVEAVGEEVLSAYFQRNDPNSPVGVRMLAAYHQQFNTQFNTRSTIQWHEEGSESLRFLYRHRQSDGQTLLPLHENGGGPAYREFDPGDASFGFRIDGHWSDPAKNDIDYDDENDNRPAHAVRVYAVKDMDGHIVPGSYLIAHDYTGLSYSNYDYQDNIYLVTNVKPTGGAAAPTNLDATGGANIALNWDAVSEGNVVGYHVYRSDSATGSFTKVTDNPVTGTTFIDATAPQNATSFYRVVAVDYHGTEGEAATADATRGTANAPAAPSNLRSTGTTVDGVSLAWIDNASGETSQTLQRRTVGGNWVSIAVLPANVQSYADSGLDAATTYEYRVFGSNAVGNSAFSNVLSATTANDQTAPAAPTSLAGTATETEVTLTWADNATNETGYVVQRRPGSGGTWSTVATLDADAATHTDTDLTGETAYQYRVFAINALGDSDFSNTLTISTTAAPTAPVAPTKLEATASGSAIALTWQDNSDNEDTFVIQRRLPGGEWQELAVVAADGTGYADTATTAATTYEYRIAAENTVGRSRFNGPVGATTPAASEFASHDIGTNVLPGSTTVVTPNSAYDMTAGGVTLFGHADSFRFTSTLVTGDFDLTVHVADYDAAEGNSRVGLMARDGLAADARHASMSFDVDMFRLYYRSSPGSHTDVRNKVPTTSVSHLRLQRDGSTFIGYVSTDGLNWTEHGRVDIDMPQSLRVGMFASATSTRATSRVEFRDLGLVGGSNLSAPLAPTETAAAPRVGAIELTWEDNSGDETGFIVQSATSGGGWNHLATLPAGSTTYDVTGLAAGQSYTFRVVAFNAAGQTAGESVTAVVPGASVAPDAPTNLEATSAATGIALEWFDASDNETNFVIQRRTVGGSWSDYVTLGADAESYFDSSATPGVTYEYRVFATNNVGDSAVAGPVQGVVPEADVTLTSTDIGPTAPGSTTVVVPGRSYDVVAGGRTIFGTSDQFRFVHGAITGDFDVKVRVGSYDAAATNSRVGLMARDGTTAGARYVALTHDGDLWRLYHREVGGAHSAGTDKVRATVGQPGWMRMVREGDTFTTYFSTDGTNWHQQAQKDMRLPETLEVGMFASATTDRDMSHVSFRDLSGFPGEVSDQPPAAPTGLGASVVNGEVRLTWTDAARHEESYRVVRREAGGSWATLADLPANASTYTDATAVVGTTYDYRVLAINTFGRAGTTLRNVEVPAPSVPDAPSELVAVERADGVTLTWADNSVNEAGFTLTRQNADGTGGTQTFNLDAGATTFTDTTGVVGVEYTYTLVATNDVGDSAAVTVNATRPEAPSITFTSDDIGNPQPGSTTVVSPGSDFDVTAGGRTIWGRDSDGLRLVHTTVTGDFEFVVRVDGYDAAATNSRVGIMARASIDPDSEYMALSHDGDLWRMYHRHAAGEQSSTTGKSSATIGQPGWMKLVRQGDEFVSYYSTDGQTWTEHGRRTMALPDTMLVGMFASSTSHNTQSTVEFRDARLTV